MHTQDEGDKLLRISDASELLGIREGTLRRWLAFRKLPTVRLGKRAIRVPLSALRAFIAQRTISARRAEE